jgi:hypothetical protein
VTVLDRFLFAVVILARVTSARYASAAVTVLDRFSFAVVMLGLVAWLALLAYMLLTGEQGPSF